MESAKKILVAVDGSTASLKALRMAHSLAEGMRAQLVLAHVHPPPLSGAMAAGWNRWGWPAELISELDRNQQQSGEELLSTMALEVGPSELPPECVQLSGSPAEAIVHAAAQDDVWMVVVGCRGGSPEIHGAMGGVSERAAHLCSKPVLVVR